MTKRDLKNVENIRQELERVIPDYLDSTNSRPTKINIIDQIMNEIISMLNKKDKKIRNLMKEKKGYNV